MCPVLYPYFLAILNIAKPGNELNVRRTEQTKIPERWGEVVAMASLTVIDHTVTCFYPASNFLSLYA